MGPRSEPLSIITIFQHPLDYPDKFVVREFLVENGSVQARTECQLADTLEEARKFIPEGRVRIKETRTFEVPAVESWV